jgi:hypothetical protein
MILPTPIETLLMIAFALVCIQVIGQRREIKRLGDITAMLTQKLYGQDDEK